ncbi:MAG: ABC transporter ATP-binding protein, partial [Acidobacteriota bacterium]
DDPEVLFLDEPTDGVDPVGRRHIRDVLLACKEGGTTIFINSHLLSEVERTCDRVAILHKGRIVREGSVEELTRPTLRFRLGLDEAPGSPLPQVEGVAVAASNGHLEVSATDLGALNRLIDRLRGEDRTIAELTPMRSDLEDVFVETVQRET